MSRTPITTVYAPRVKPSTQYTKRTPIQSDLGYLITQLGILNNNLGQRILFHTGIFEDSPTEYSRPRKASLIFDEQGLQLGLENGELLLEEGGNKDNIIQTIYT